MLKLRNFFKRSLIGGVLVILPLIILVFFFRWVFYLVTDLIKPISDWVLVRLDLPGLVADGFVMILIIAVCFLIGTLVATGFGRWLHERFDKYLVKLAPGYRLVREIVGQFFGDANSPFSKGEVVKVRLFGKDCPTTVTAIVTARHLDGQVTIFMPTGPNPTSGNIYHVPDELVEYLPHASVEWMMKTIIACGAGSDKLFKKE